MNITIQGVNITLTPDQLQQIDIEVKKLNKSAKPTSEQRLLTLIQNLEIRIDLQYTDRISLFKGDEFYFEYNTRFSIIWCSYKNVWKIFEDEYSMKPYNVQCFMKDVLEKHFKMKGVTLHTC